MSHKQKFILGAHDSTGRSKVTHGICSQGSFPSDITFSGQMAGQLTQQSWCASVGKNLTVVAATPAAGYEVLSDVTLLLGKWFLAFCRHYNHVKHPETPNNIVSHPTRRVNKM
jgi:hypothetical protein